MSVTPYQTLVNVLHRTRIYAVGTYNRIANSFAVRLSVCEVRTRACVLKTGGDVSDKRLALAETGVVRWATRAEVGTGKAVAGTSYTENQVSVRSNNRHLHRDIQGRDWRATMDTGATENLLGRVTKVDVKCISN